MSSDHDQRKGEHSHLGERRVLVLCHPDASFVMMISVATRIAPRIPALERKRFMSRSMMAGLGRAS